MRKIPNPKSFSSSSHGAVEDESMQPKKQNPASSSTMKQSFPKIIQKKIKKNMLHCKICEFSTRDNRAYRVHKKRHEENSIHSCRICSFSVPRLALLEKHVECHHLKRLQSLRPTQKNPADSSEDGEEWYHAPGGTRMRYKFCKNCDYKTTSLHSFEQHVKSAHSVSKAEAVMRNEERRRSHPNVAPKRSENRETAKRGNQASLPAPRKANADPTTRQATSQKKAQTSTLLNTSISSIASHSSFRQWSGSFSMGPPAKSRVTRILHQCPDCKFSTTSTRDHRKHEVLHQKKSDLQCHLCSYSVRLGTHLKRHLTRHHSAQEIAADHSGSFHPDVNVEQVPMKRTRHDFLIADSNGQTEKSFTAQFSLRECRVVLVDVGVFGAEKFAEAEKSPIEEREDKIKELQTRVENLIKKVQLADEDAEQIVNEKNDLKKEIEELERRKVKLEGDLHTGKCKGNINDLEGQVNDIESDLFALRELEKSLSEDFEIVQMSSTGAAQVLSALRLELEGLSS